MAENASSEAGKLVEPLPDQRRPWRRWLPWVVVGALLLVGVVGVTIWQMERWSLRSRGLALAGQGDWVKAEPLLRLAVEFFPGDVDVVRNLALAQSRARRSMIESEGPISRWCEVEPDSPEPFRLRLTLYLRMTQYAKALEDVRRLRKMLPNDQGIRNTLIDLLELTQHYDEAEELCRASLAAHRDDPRLHFLLARIYHVQGKKAETDATLERLLKLAPNHARGLLLRGERLCEERDYKKAIPVLRDVLETKEVETYMPARYKLSLALAETGQKAEAETLLRKNARVQEVQRLVNDCLQMPENPEAQTKAAQALLALGAEARQSARLLARNLAQPTRETQQLLAEYFRRYDPRGAAAQRQSPADEEP